MSDRAVRRLARALFGLECVLLAGGAVALAALAELDRVLWREVAPDMLLALTVFVFPVVGVVIARRHARNAVAWVLLGVGLAWMFSFAMDAYTGWGFAYPRQVPGAEYVAAFSNGMWLPGVVPLGTFLLLLFPDGHLPTPRWRRWAWFCGISMIVAYTVMTLTPGVLSEIRPPLMNPLGVPALGQELAALQGTFLLIPASILGSVVALVRRFRRSRGMQRLQMKWFVTACTVVGLLYVAAILLSIPFDWGAATAPRWITVLQNSSFASFLLIPIAVAIAITRYHLYDIDRLINRALVYATLSALLAAVYAAGVVGSQNLLREVTGNAQNNLSVAASTLAVAALFGPVRTWVQTLVDRRFYRSKYDAVRTVEAFSAHLRQETDLATLTHQLRGVVDHTVQPSGVSVWIAAPAPRQG